jgi:hypothetical protein
LSIKCQHQVGSLSIAFVISLNLAYFLSEAKRIFINFFTSHHNLGSSGVTPSHLEDFTSKNNKCHEDCFTKLKCSQRGCHLTLSLDFSQISLRGEEKRSQRLQGRVFSLVEPAPSKGGRGKCIYTIPKN